MIGKLVKRLEDRAFRRRGPHRPPPHIHRLTGVIDVTIGVADAGWVVAEKRAPMDDDRGLRWQALQPWWNGAVEMSARRTTEAEVVGITSQIERAFAAQMHIALHDPLQREQRISQEPSEEPCTPSGRGRRYTPRDDPLQPPARHIAVDGFGIDALGLEP